MKHILRSITLVLSALAYQPAEAKLTIEITGGIESPLPVALVPFGWTGSTTAPPVDLAEIVANDLARSGRFAPMPEQDLIARPHEGSDIRFGDWRLLGMENLVVGRMHEIGAGRYEIQFQLFDVFKGAQLAGYSFPAERDELRRAAHRISDIVYEKLTGQKGAFTTRIAYVTASKDTEGNRIFDLNIADADGFNEQNILHSKRPLMSPSWAPDARRIAYVSFEAGRPQVFVQGVFTGKRDMVADYSGLNGAPAWSPGGQRLALTLSKDGNAEIYVLDLRTRALQRITRNSAIDTEAAWSPDGRSLVFTSDRGGRPQLYRIELAESRPKGPAKRITFEGEYNARAAFSPDGKMLAMVHGSRGAYRIAVLELQTGVLRVLTDSRLDESPSFAPNGSMIIYATEHNNQGVMAAVSVDGRVHQRLLLSDGNVREPAWSPFTE